MKLEEIKEKARRHEQRDEWQKALDLYREALRLHPKDEPEDIGLYNRVGDLQIRLRQTDAAVATYEKAIQLYLDAELPNNAIAVCKKVLRNLPDRYHFHRLMGRIRAQQGFLTDARQNFLTFAELTIASGDMETALESLLEFVELSPEDLDIRIGLAGQLAARGKTAEAVAQYSQAYRLLARQGLKAEAEEIAARLKELDPSLQVPEPESLHLAGAPREYEESPMEAEAAGGPSPVGIELDLGEITLSLPEGRVAGVLEARGEEGGEALTSEGYELVGPSESLEEALEEGAREFLEGEGTTPALAEPLLGEDLGEGALPFLDLGVGEPEADQTREEEEALPFLAWQEEEEGGPKDGITGVQGERELFFADMESRGPEAAGAPVGGEALPLLGALEEEPPDVEGEGGEGLVGVRDLPFLELGDEAVSLAAKEVPQEALPLLTWEEPEALSEESPPSIPGFAEEEWSRQSPTPQALSGTSVGAADAEEAEAPFREETKALDEFGPWSGVEVGGRRWAAAPIDQLDETLESVKELIRREPDSLELHQRLVELAFRKGEPGELVSAYLDLASCLRRIGSPLKARAVYQQVLSLYPGQEEARKALVDLEAEARPRPVVEVAASEEYVDLGALVFGDEESETTRWKVTAHAPTGDDQADFARMLSQFKKKVVEHLDVEDVAAHYDLGTAYMEMGLLDEAVAEFQTALRARPGHLPTFEMLGRCWSEMGKPEMAVRTLQRALHAPWDVEDELIGIYYHLAKAHERLGNRQQALEFYEKVFALDINFLDVTERLRALR